MESASNYTRVTANEVTVVINGVDLHLPRRSTILEAAEQAGFIVPTLCHSTWLGHTGNCMVCVVEVVGHGLLPACSTTVWDQMVVLTESLAVLESRRIAAERLLEEHYADCVAPCTLACPSGIDVQGYVKLIAQGRMQAAVDLIRETNPLPGVCGRICPHPCEDACRRQLVEEPVAICSLKRTASDVEAGTPLPLPALAEPSGQAVAIVGGGPAGLSAAFFLRKAGHEVTVFEAQEKAGGMLRYGIPEYRLPRPVLDQEIARIVDMGVRLETKQRLGHELEIIQLLEQYDAVFLAMGAWDGQPLRVSGEEVPGVFSGIEFLHQINSGKPMTIGRRVAVVGGGNTAMDSARTALRLGAEEVSVIYRRAREQMPADPLEVEEAEEEGVIFHFLTNPIACLGDERLSGLRMVQMRLGAPDASGRPRPEPVPDSEFDLDVDMVIAAIGQQPDNASFAQLQDVQRDRWGNLVVDEHLATSHPRLYAGGDLVTGAATAVEAIGAGRRAAQTIDAHLRGEEPAPAPFSLIKGKPGELLGEEFSVFAQEERAANRMIAPEVRKRTFDESNLGMDLETAQKEAQRCIECGCKAAHDCALRELADLCKVSSEEFPVHRRYYPPRLSHPLLAHDPNRCIGCGQCVRVCQEVQGANALGMTGRMVVAGQLERLEDSPCVSCGQCITACPVGAIVAKEYLAPSEETKTVCPYCGVGCGVVLGTRAGELVSVRPDEDSPVNRGLLCVKGRFGLDFIDHEQRLKTPLIKRGDTWQPASWSDALAYIAERLRPYVGTEQLGVFGSAKCTNEEMYVLQKFTRAVLKTNNIDHCARLCHAPSVAGLRTALGSGAMTNPISDVREADCLLSIGSNTTESHPVIGLEVKAAVRNGAKLIVANPLWIELCRYADCVLQHRPGTDVLLLGGLAKIIYDEGWFDEDFIAQRCDGFSEYAAYLDGLDLQEVVQTTGVSEEKLRQAARLYGESDKASILYAMGITQHAHGTDNVLAVANLALLTGNFGRPGTGVNPLRGQNNVQGACDVGVLPNVLPGYQAVDDEQLRGKFEALYGTELPPKPGLPMTLMLQAAREETLKALYIVGENPMLSEADSHHTREALEKLDFLVVQDIFLTETAQLADVVLPSAAFAEKDGTFVNTERRVQRVQKVRPAPGEALTDWEIVCQLAQAMGAGGFDYDESSQIMEEMTQLMPTWGGINYDRLDEGGLCWPCPSVDHPGTPRLHEERFLRENGRGLFTPLTYVPPFELPDDEYPLLLTTGRILEHFHTGTMSRRVQGLTALQGAERVRMNPQDAQEQGIADGDWICIRSRRGEVQSEVAVTEQVPPGTVFMTFHFAEACANVLTNPVLDPKSNIPEFKVCAVRITAL